MDKKDLKVLKFHEIMITKADIEVAFWQREVRFHEDKIMKLKNKDEEFT